jgi:hypothetical protein
LEGYRDEREVKQIQIMPGDMTIKSSLLGEILEKLASLRMNVTIRLDDDREEGDPVCSAYILIFIDFAGICYC